MNDPNRGTGNPKRRLLPEEGELARDLRARDPKIYSWGELGRMFGTSDYQVQMAVYPEKVKARNDEQNRRKARIVAQARENGRYGGDPELAWLRAQIPPDTRDLTGKLLGDPVPQRSALAQRNQGARS